MLYSPRVKPPPVTVRRCHKTLSIFHMLDLSSLSYNSCSVRITQLITCEDLEYTSAYNRHVTTHTSGNWFPIAARGQVRGEDGRVHQEVPVRSLLAPSSRNHRILVVEGPASSTQRSQGRPQETGRRGEGQNMVLAFGDLGATAS